MKNVLFFVLQILTQGKHDENHGDHVPVVAKPLPHKYSENKNQTWFKCSKIFEVLL